MEKTYYVVQRKENPWDNKHWITLPGKYESIREAEAARQKKPAPSECRVAEAYIQVRYKAVKNR